jgi:hypothetical protein
MTGLKVRGHAATFGGVLSVLGRGTDLTGQDLVGLAVHSLHSGLGAKPSGCGCLANLFVWCFGALTVAIVAVLGQLCVR